MDRAVAGCVPDGGFVRALGSWMFSISPAPAAFAKRASKAFSSAKVMFSRLRPEADRECFLFVAGRNSEIRDVISSAAIVRPGVYA